MNGIIYGVYMLISLLLIFLLYRESYQHRLMKVVVVATLPGIGWLLPIFWPKWLIGEGKEEFEDYITRQQEEHKVRRIGIYQRVERQQELDIIPIEEALLVNEYKTRRKVIIDVLKHDSISHLSVLQRAVSNEDKETSYYAVSAIMEAKRKLQLSLQELSVKFEADSTDLDVVSVYADVLKAYMGSGFLDERTLMKNRYTYLSVLKQLTELDPGSEWAYVEIVEIEMTLNSYHDAEQHAQLYIEKFPNSENAYLCLMKVYYCTRSFCKLQEVLDSLKKAPIKLSNHALTTVRFWSEGEQHYEK